MKNLRKKIVTWPLMLVLLLIISAVIFNDLRATKGKNIQASTINAPEDKNSNSYAITDNNNSDNNGQVSENHNLNTNSNNSVNSSADYLQLTTDAYSMPIIMYHHIRDFNDPEDKIGTNLSLSPSDFSKQLDLIESRGYTTINFQDIIDNKVPNKSVVLTFDDGYENFYQNAYPELKKRGMKAVSFIIVNDVGKEGYMTREQIGEIEQNGIEIGSHTLSHPDLATSSDAKAKKEIANSKAYLEELIVKKVISICYPSGKYSATTESLAESAGYDFAVTTKSGLSTFSDPFALNRYRVNNGTSISNWIK